MFKIIRKKRLDEIEMKLSKLETRFNWRGVTISNIKAGFNYEIKKLEDQIYSLECDIYELKKTQKLHNDILKRLKKSKIM